MLKVGYAYGAIAATLVTDAYPAASSSMELDADAADAFSEDFPSTFLLDRIEVQLSSITGGLTTGDTVSARLFWDSTNLQLVGIEATATFQLGQGSTTVGTVVFPVGAYLRKRSAVGSAGKLYLQLKLSRAAATAAAKAYAYHVTEVA